MREHLESLDPRRAGEATRYFSWSRLREQSIGEHSWQVARVLLAIWPEAPRHLLVHCLTHDVGEVASGDPPYPSKRDNADLKAACDRVEHEAHLKMCLPWGLPPPVTLGTEERSVFKLAEMIEMWEWGLRELEMGNARAALVAERCWTAVSDWMDKHESSHVHRETERYIMMRRAAHDQVVSRCAA